MNFKVAEHDNSHTIVSIRRRSVRGLLLCCCLNYVSDFTAKGSSAAGGGMNFLCVEHGATQYHIHQMLHIPPIINIWLLLSQGVVGGELRVRGSNIAT